MEVVAGRVTRTETFDLGTLVTHILGTLYLVWGSFGAHVSEWPVRRKLMDIERNRVHLGLRDPVAHISWHIWPCNVWGHSEYFVSNGLWFKNVWYCSEADWSLDFGTQVTWGTFALYRFFLSIRPPAYKTMVLCTGKIPVYKTMVLYCTIFLELGIRVPNI